MTAIRQSGVRLSKRNAKPKCAGPSTTDAGKKRSLLPCASENVLSRRDFPSSRFDAPRGPLGSSGKCLVYLAFLGGLHVPKCALWSDSGEQCARHQPPVARDQESHDR